MPDRKELYTKEDYCVKHIGEELQWDNAAMKRQMLTYIVFYMSSKQSQSDIFTLEILILLSSTNDLGKPNS